MSGNKCNNSFYIYLPSAVLDNETDLKIYACID